jgi:hypothetical protein
LAELFAVKFENYLRAMAGQTKMRISYYVGSVGASQSLESDDGHDGSFTSSSPDYFKNMVLPLKKGEYFQYTDRDGPSDQPGLSRDNTYRRTRIIIIDTIRQKDSRGNRIRN